MWLRPVLIPSGGKKLPARQISATLHARRTTGYGNATNILK
jgi:hypothetical protein